VLTHTPDRDRAVARFSKLGEHGALWLALAGVGAAFRPERRSAFMRAAATVLIAYGVNQAIKYTVRRARPADQLAATVSQLSYPSAHAATSVAGARSLAGLLPAAPLGALAAAVALSRLYLGVHYPSDVVAGCALGAAVAELRR